MIKLLTELNSVFPHESKVLEIIWVGKRLNTKSTDFHFLKKHYFVWHSKDLWALEKLIIVSRGREGSSHLCGEVFVESKTLCPPGTAHCCSALSRATFGKGTQAGCGSSIFFFLNSRIDVTLASIHIPASMWGSNCEGYPFGLSGSWLPLTGSWVSAELATLYSGRLPDLSSWHFPNWVGVGAQGGIGARWKCDFQWRQNPSWKTFGKSSLIFPPLRDLQSNHNIKG